MFVDIAPEIYIGLSERAQRNILHPIETLEIEYITHKVIDHFNVPISEIFTASRERRLVIPRQIIAYLAYKTKRYTLKYIGKLMNRDHSSIIHSIEQVNDQMSIDKKFKAMIEEIESSLFEMELQSEMA